MLPPVRIRGSSTRRTGLPRIDGALACSSPGAESLRELRPGRPPNGALGVPRDGSEGACPTPPVRPQPGRGDRDERHHERDERPAGAPAARRARARALAVGARLPLRRIPGTALALPARDDLVRHLGAGGVERRPHGRRRVLAGRVHGRDRRRRPGRVDGGTDGGGPCGERPRIVPGRRADAGPRRGPCPCRRGGGGPAGRRRGSRPSR